MLRRSGARECLSGDGSLPEASRVAEVREIIALCPPSADVLREEESLGDQAMKSLVEKGLLRIRILFEGDTIARVNLVCLDKDMWVPKYAIVKPKSRRK